MAAATIKAKSGDAELRSLEIASGLLNLSASGSLQDWSGAKKLRVEAAALSAPQRIETRARSLGLRYPGPRQVVHLPARDVAAGAPE